MTRIEQLEQRLKRLEQKVCCKTQFVDELPAEGNEGSLYVLPDGSVWVWDGLAFVSTSTTESYYSNSYVDRLKALGSDVQYSNYLGGTVTSTLILTDSRLILTSVYIPKTSTISNIGWRQNTAGDYTEDNYNGIGIYSINTTTGDLTLIGKTVNDGTIWKTVVATGYGNKDLETPVVLEKGIYFLGFLYNSLAVVTAPGLGYSTTSLGTLSNMAFFNTPTNTYLTAYLSGQTNLPTNILQSSLTFSPASANDVLFWLS